MNAPDKIYLTPLLVEGCGKNLSKRVTENDAVYIREDLIKAEIERLMDGYKPIVGGTDELTGAHIVLAKLLSFLSTTENKSARQRLAEWSKTPEGRESYEKVAEEMRRGAEEGEALEKEIGSYMSNKWKFGCVTPITPVVLPNFTTEDLKECARHFANWQKEQYHFFNEAWADNMQYQLDRNYENGKQAMKEQMMKEAISCNVIWHDCPLLDYTQEQQDNALERIGANVGDKVKIIIVKEDKK